MKKIFITSLAALAVLVGCNKQDIQAPEGDGTVKISLAIPEMMSAVTKAGVDYVNSAKGGVTNMGADAAKWDVQITSKNDGLVAFSDQTGTGASYSADVTLVTGEEYVLVAKAAFDPTGTFNAESEDCYEYTTEFTASSAPISGTLIRPFGKLRLIADDYGVMNAQTGRSLQSIAVTYQGATAVTSEVNNYTADAAGTKTVFVDYLAPESNGSAKMYPFTIVITFNDNTEKTIVVNQDIPVKKNCLTTVRGNLFTGVTKLTLVIDEEFDNVESYNPEGLRYVENIQEFGDFYKNGVALANDMTLDQSITIANVEDVTIDLNGKTLYLKDKQIFSEGKITLKNGKLVTEKDGNNNVSTIIVTNEVVAENIECTFCESLFLVEKGGKLTVNNSELIGDEQIGYFAISSNASTALATDDPMIINLNNVVMKGSETPIMLNIPSDVNIDGCTIEGRWQGMAMRGGKAVIKNSSIAYLAPADITTAQNEAAKHMNSWGSGNNYVRAALVLGNRGTGAYQYPTNVSLENTVVKVIGENAALFPTVYAYANAADGLGVTFAYDAATKFIAGKAPMYASSNIVVNGKPIVAASAVASMTFDPAQDYVIGAGVLEIEASKPIAAKSITFEGTEFKTTTNVAINAETVVLKGIKVIGSEKNKNNSTINIEGATSITVDGADFDMTGSRCYNGFEINLGSGALANIDIKNVNFNTPLSNNAICIYRTASNAVVNIENCYFKEVSNPLRLSNADNATGVVVNVKDCTVDKWETVKKYAGFLMCEDNTSKTKAECQTNNLFAKDKITVNFINLTHPNTGIDYKTMQQSEYVGGDNQLYYVWLDHGSNTNGACALAYGDGANHPTINVY